MKYVKIKKIQEKEAPVRVYNVGVKKNNNYFANGVLVHNCFAYSFKTNNSNHAGKDVFQLRSVNQKHLLKVIRGEIPDNPFWQHFFSKKFLFHWGGLADPFCNFESEHKVGMEIMEGLAEIAYPTLFSFKGAAINLPEYMKFFEKHAHKHSFAFQSSTITNSDKLSQAIEIGVPTTTQRLKTIKRLSDMGYYTILRLRPFVIGLSDEGLDELLQRAFDAGVRGVSVEFFAMDKRCNENMQERFQWIGKLMGTKDIFKYYNALSPSERGGYQRLNRLVKEPYIKTIYKFCAEHDLVCGISDPDYKELNTSGSCCGMPDSYPENPDLCNWTRNQLTCRMADLRRRYAKDGTCGTLTFTDVYKPEVSTWLEDPRFGNFNVGMVGTPGAERMMKDQRFMILDKWNNLRSPSNPANYLHGKVLPCGIDSEGNLVYKYQPHPYEQEWAAEGIDMTR